jgi:hypothetical protein
MNAGMVKTWTLVAVVAAPPSDRTGELLFFLSESPSSLSFRFLQDWPSGLFPFCS